MLQSPATPPPETCAKCNSQSVVVVLPKVVHPDGGAVDFYQCKACGVVSQKSRPLPA